MLSKGIKVDFYHLKENYEVVPLCIVFNDKLRFPIKDKYRSKVQIWKFELNPIKISEKLVLLIELMHMEDLNQRKLSLVNKKMLPDWYPPTRIVD